MFKIATSVSQKCIVQFQNFSLKNREQKLFNPLVYAYNEREGLVAVK